MLIVSFYVVVVWFEEKSEVEVALTPIVILYHLNLYFMAKPGNQYTGYISNTTTRLRSLS